MIGAGSLSIPQPPAFKCRTSQHQGSDYRNRTCNDESAGPNRVTGIATDIRLR